MKQRERERERERGNETERDRKRQRESEREREREREKGGCKTVQRHLYVCMTNAQCSPQCSHRLCLGAPL